MDAALRVLRPAFAALALTALGVQFFSRSTESAFKALNFVSFFTVQSNLIAVAALTAAALGHRHDLLRGAAVLYLAITGLVFALLLSGLQEDLQLTIPWVDTVLHRVMPIVVVVDWLLDPPERRLGVREALTWLAFPVAWTTYTLVRGAVTGWYPYPFIDPGLHGAGRVAVNCAVILVGFVAVAALVVVVGDVRRRQRSSAIRSPGPNRVGTEPPARKPTRS